MLAATLSKTIVSIDESRKVVKNKPNLYLYCLPRLTICKNYIGVKSSRKAVLRLPMLQGMPVKARGTSMAMTKKQFAFYVNKLQLKKTPQEIHSQVKQSLGLRVLMPLKKFPKDKAKLLF